MPAFIDNAQLRETGRVYLGEWTEPWLEELSAGLSELGRRTGFQPVQRGRVLAVRHTDAGRLYSALKAALYHSNYHDLLNVERYLDRILAAHHSNEPIRGETVLFLFVGVGKSVYDGLTMFTAGRPTRICGGTRHSVPWGVEVPVGVRDREGFAAATMPLVREVAELSVLNGRTEEQEQRLEQARGRVPQCAIMAPFLLEFSEEALVTHVFRQRLWESGTAARDTGAVCEDMWRCCMALDEHKFGRLRDHYGPHVTQWEDGMRALRDEDVSAQALAAALVAEDEGDGSAYGALMRYFARRRP